MLPQPDNSRVQPGENNAEDNLRPLETVMPLLDELFGLELPFERVSQQCMIALDKIGNRYRTRHCVVVDCEAGFAQLPLNCDRIEAVLSSTSYADLVQPGLTTSSWHPDDTGPYVEANNWPELNLQPNTTPDQLVGRVGLWPAKQPIDARQLGARLLNYTFRDGGVYVGYQASTAELTSQATGLSGSAVAGALSAVPVYPEQVLVFYQGRVGDERGYPLITPEEALGCAYYVQFVQVQKRYFMREATAQDFQLATQLKEQHIAQARVAPLASANALDKIMDESKRYHRSFFTDDTL